MTRRAVSYRLAAAAVFAAGCGTPKAPRAPSTARPARTRPGPARAGPARPGPARPAPARPAAASPGSFVIFLKVDGPGYRDKSGLAFRVKVTGTRETVDREVWGVYTFYWTAMGKTGRFTILGSRRRPFVWYGEKAIPGFALRLLGRHVQGVKVRILPGVPKTTFKDNQVMAVVARRVGMKRLAKLGQMSSTVRWGSYYVEWRDRSGVLVLRMVVGSVTGAVLYQWLAKSMTAGPSPPRR